MGDVTGHAGDASPDIAPAGWPSQPWPPPPNLRHHRRGTQPGIAMRDGDTAGNGSENGHLNELIDRRRRAWLAGGAALAAFAPAALTACATTAAKPRFVAVPAGVADAVVVPPGYAARVLYAWGDPIDGRAPAFAFDASNSAAEQALQAGMHHDGMHFFPLPRGGRSSTRGLLAINHEYVDHGLLFADGAADWSREKVAKAVAAHGVSIVEVARGARGWHVVPSAYARRITAATPMRLGGPAAGHALLRTAADRDGRTVLGTLANCAAGKTPWGTYLTCEENFHGYFAFTAARTRADAVPAELRRYGIGLPRFDRDGRLAGYGFGVRWHEFEARFDLGQHPHEGNRFGWVVEIDPSDPASTPVKRTALGRIKHECADVVIARDGRVVVYTSDDERNEYLYKFVADGRFDARDPFHPRHRDLLDRGTLYVARFDADGSGQWLALAHGQNGLTPANGFADQGEVLVKTRQAADRAGATMMDRPEWITHDQRTNTVYVALTNNALRGAAPPSGNRADGTSAASSARPPVDAANPRANNVYGHIVRWDEAGGDPAALRFDWEVFLLAGDPSAVDAAARGNVDGDAFGSPDGLWIDDAGILWIQTDVSTGTINRGAYEGMGNNQMLACDPVTREVRRFLVGPPGCEVTGMAMTPDRRTMFVNIQHPGENAAEGPTDPAAPRRGSNWPDFRPDGRPRSATIAITRDDGGTIGD
jgi:secreted PhoX family phosphatase